MPIIIIILLQVAQAITITSGEVVTDKGEQLTIGSGSFIPSPFDMELAQKILGYKEKVLHLELDLKIEIEKFEVFKEASRTREDKIKDFYLEKYRAERLENEILNSWWNRYGKIILWVGVSIAGSAFLVWGMCRYTEEMGC
uniref:Uncharacterized protein n=1 Tax=viral metagenome TaxID=1070528 RepID=A0A6H2A1P3_9ZZZZ